MVREGKAEYGSFCSVKIPHKCNLIKTDEPKKPYLNDKIDGKK